MANEDKQVIVSCDFVIKGHIPKEALELFALAQASIANLRGYIVQVSENCFKGQLEGQETLIESFKKVLELAAEFVNALKEFIIENLKVIEEYTYDGFEVRQSPNTNPSPN